MAAKVHRLDDARRQLSAGTRVLDDVEALEGMADEGREAA